MSVEESPGVGLDVLCGSLPALVPLRGLMIWDLCCSNLTLGWGLGQLLLH